MVFSHVWSQDSILLRIHDPMRKGTNIEKAIKRRKKIISESLRLWTRGPPEGGPPLSGLILLGILRTLPVFPALGLVQQGLIIQPYIQRVQIREGRDTLHGRCHGFICLLFI